MRVRRSTATTDAVTRRSSTDRALQPIEDRKAIDRRRNGGRRRAASKAAEPAGPPPAKAIQELAGHESLSTTLRYMHLSPSALDHAIRLLDHCANMVPTDSGGARSG